MKVVIGLNLLAWMAVSPLLAESLFDAEKIGCSYVSKFTQAPRWESSTSGIGMDLNLGLVSLILDIHYTDDVDRVRRDKQKLASVGQDVLSRLTVKGFSRDLRDIWLNVNFENPHFGLASKKNDFNVLIKAAVESCNDERVPEVIEPRAKLEDIVAGFREFDFSQALYCRLRISKITTNAIRVPVYNTSPDGFNDRIEVNSSGTDNR